MMIVRMIERADREFIDALVVHDQRWKLKGRNLYRETIDTMSLIGQEPLRFPSIDSRHRRAVLPFCPFSLLYRIRPDGIWVIAMAHHKQKPGYWSRRKIPNPQF